MLIYTDDMIGQYWTVTDVLVLSDLSSKICNTFFFFFFKDYYAEKSQ